jgi:molybdopterin-guanine dinucleotide biosynthesis protein A
MGRDKATLLHASGATFLSLAVNRVRAVCDQVCVSTAPGPIPADVTDVHQICDAVAYQGPIRGVLQCLDFAKHHGFAACLVTPVDMPYLDADHLRALRDAWLRDSDQLICATATGSHQLEPLVAIYPIRLADSIRLAAASDDRSLNRWMQRHQPILVSLPGQASRNVNTPADL